MFGPLRAGQATDRVMRWEGRVVRRSGCKVAQCKDVQGSPKQMIGLGGLINESCHLKAKVTQ